MLLLEAPNVDMIYVGKRSSLRALDVALTDVERRWLNLETDSR